jgi:hypothetical protein
VVDVVDERADAEQPEREAEPGGGGGHTPVRFSAHTLQREQRVDEGADEQGEYELVLTVTENMRITRGES